MLVEVEQQEAKKQPRHLRLLPNLQHLMRERMLRNLDKSQRTRTFFKSTLASLVEELERRSTQLLVCLEQLEISSLAVGMEDLMHCYEPVSYTHLTLPDERS